MIWLIVFAIFFCALGFTYYHYQNKKQRIGGAISKPKAYWLFFCLFLYYFMPIWFISYFNELPSTQIFIYKGIICIMVLRLVFQGIYMFYIKKWTPKFGIAFNFFLVLFILTTAAGAFDQFGVEPFQYTALLIALMAVIDSYYAYTFRKLVEGKTVGEEAIWYAAENDDRFQTINRLTFRNNLIVTVLFILIIWALVINSL